MNVYNVEVQVKVRANDEKQAYNLVHDYMAAHITGVFPDKQVVDFEILDEAVTKEED